MITCPVQNCSKELVDKRGLHSHLRVHGLEGGEIHAMANKVDSDRSKSKSPDDWANRRQNILRRDNYVCQECGSDNADSLHVHHKTPLSEGGSNNSENLVTLCSECHGDKHPNNPLVQGRNTEPRTESIHHHFRLQLSDKHGLSYEAAKKYDDLHNELMRRRVESLFH